MIGPIKTLEGKPPTNFGWMNLVTLGILLVASQALHGCDCCPTGKPDELATRIRRIVVTPNPVPKGQTAVFKVFADDSLDTTLEYRWTLPGGSIVATTMNSYDWTATVPPGEYEAIIRIQRSGYLPNSAGFKVIVVE